MIIREARSKEEIQDFVMLVAEYLNSLPFEELCGKVVFGIHGTEVESLS